MGLMVSVSIWVYSRLLRLYPSEHRQQFEREQLQVFRDSCLERYRRSGLLGIVTLWMLTSLDLPRSVLGVRRDKAEADSSRVPWPVLETELPRSYVLIQIFTAIVSLIITSPSADAFLQEHAPWLYDLMLSTVAVSATYSLRAFTQALDRARRKMKS